MAQSLELTDVFKSLWQLFFIFSPNDRPSKTEKCFLFHPKSSFGSRDIQIFLFPSPPLYLSVGHCFTG